MRMDEHDRISEAVRVEHETQLASMADFDEAEYMSFLSGLDITAAQASELLRILWDISRMCIEMDLPPESWGQITSAIYVSAARDSDKVE